jgi:POT family proton-dependent oligopeptide transporter
MLFGLVLYWVAGHKYLAPDNLAKKRDHAHETGPYRTAHPDPEPPAQPFTKAEWNAVLALCVICALNIVFWAVYEQQGNTMQTWADEQTRWPVLFGFQVPATWFQSVNPFFIFTITPLLTALWKRQSEKGTEPSSVSKMAIGCIVLGLSFIVMIVGARVVGADKGSWLWPVVCTMLLTIGEIYLSPVGLSLVTKVSPPRIVNMMMGVWYLSSFFGNLMSGYIGVYYTRWSKDTFFLLLLAMGIATGIAIWAFNQPLKRAMGHRV